MAKYPRKLVLKLSNGRTLECTQTSEFIGDTTIRLLNVSGIVINHWNSTEVGSCPEYVMWEIFQHCSDG